MGGLEHGSYNLAVEDSILIVDAKGPFNKETITQYRLDLEGLIKTLVGTAWSQIIVLHQMSIFTPEAANELMTTLEWRKTIGLQRSAVVMVEPVGAHLIREQMGNIYRQTNLDFEFFDSIDDAKYWIKAAIEKN